jgi:inosine-uridine nucleoside N-ribohydrolase
MSTQRSNGTTRRAGRALGVGLILGAFTAIGALAGEGYGWQVAGLTQADFDARRLPEIPPKGERIRVILDTDAFNEIDDQWAMALALLAPERFEILGLVAANFDHPHGGPSSVESSLREIELVLDKMGLAGRFPIYRGSHPMRYKYEPSPSEGVDFMVETALASPPDDPVWLVALGSATNLASAYLSEPRIAERAVFFWHGRTRWPDYCHNFNVFGDPIAARTLFHNPIPFVLFDTGGHLSCPMEESERRVAPYGEIGEYLHEFRKTNDWFMQSDKGFFDLGDIAALLDPDIGEWVVEQAPEVKPYLEYDFSKSYGPILRCKDVDRDATFELLYERLAAAYGSKPE